MCRKNHLQGCTAAAFGLGMMVGYSMESWLLCFCGGVGLIVFGFLLGKQR